MDSTEDKEKRLRQEWLAIKTAIVIAKYRGSQSDAGIAIADLSRGSALGRWKTGDVDPFGQSLYVIIGLARELGWSVDQLLADLQNYVDEGMGRSPSKPQPVSEIRRIIISASYNPLTDRLNIDQAGLSIGEPEQPDYDIEIRPGLSESDRLRAFGRILDRSVIIWCRLRQVNYQDNRAVSQALPETVAIDPERLALLRAGLVAPSLVGGELGKIVSLGMYRVDGTKLADADIRCILGLANGKETAKSRR